MCEYVDIEKKKSEVEIESNPKPIAIDPYSCVIKNENNYMFFYKQHFYKQGKTEIGKKSSKC